MGSGCRLVWLGMIGAGLVTGAAPRAEAQDAPDPQRLRQLQQQLRSIDSTYRLRIPPEQPISERLMLDYGGSVRFGMLLVDNQVGETRTLRQTDGILYLRAELDGAHRFFGRLRFLYDDFNGRDSFDGRGDELREPIGDRYWYQFDLRGLMLAESGERPDYNLNAKVGRQFVNWGSGLALSNVLYAGLVDLEIGTVGLVGLLGQTPSTGTIDFDGSRPGFDSDVDRAYIGGALEYRGLPTHRPYFAALAQRDKNDRNFTVVRTPFADYPTRFDYNSEYYAIGSRGSFGPQLNYRVEVVHQRGDTLSSPFNPRTGAPITQTRDDIEAWAGVAGLTWLFRDEGDSSLDFEVIGGSGDGDRIDPSDTFGGNVSGTTDGAFNGLGYVNTGLALAPEIANLLAFRCGFSTSPSFGGRSGDWLRVGIDGFLFAKIDSRAPLSIRTNEETFIGGEIDVSVDWRITSDISATLRYGIFLPGDAMPAGEDDPRHFFYAGVTYAF